MKTKIFLAAGAIALATIFASCDKHDTAINPTSGGGSSASSMRVKMTDSPGDYVSLNMSVTSVQAYLQDSGWITLNNNVHTMNVISLTNGSSTDLSYNTNIKTGVYTKIKLVFGENNTIVVNGSGSGGGGSIAATYTLTWTGPREVEIPIHKEINAGTYGEVFLDFNVVSSISNAGNQYVINPVITEINDAKTGVKGTVQAGAHAAVVLSNGLFASSTYADASGNFIFYSISPGTYTMHIYPTLQQIAQGAHEKTIEGVIVTNGQIKQMGMISLQ
jgi:hypothetical protein